MDRSIYVGLILFGLLALGGTIDGARRKILQQPDWVGLNWGTFLKGIVGWCVVGLIALVIGIVGALS